MMIRLFLILAMAVRAFAATYYVATTGSNANPGTIVSPFLTVQHAVDVARAGDTILVGAGTYAEQVRTADFAGSAGNPIVINGQNVATVGSITWENPFLTVINFHFNGKNIVNGQLYVSQSASSCISSNNVFDANNDPTITPLVRWNGPASAPFGTAGSDNLIISNEFKNVRGEMVFRIYGYRNRIFGNFIYHIDNTDFFHLAGGTNYIVGNVCSNIYQSGLNPNNHADFLQIFGDAGGTFQASKGHLVESNIVIKADGVAQLGNLTDDGYAYVTDLTIRNNMFIGVAAKMSIAMPNVHFYNNLFYNCATNLENGGPVLIFADNITGHGNGGQVFNNAFINCGPAGLTNTGGTYFPSTLTNVASDYNYVIKDGKPVQVDPLHRAVGAPGGWDTSDWWEPNGINGTIKNVAGVTSAIAADPKFVNSGALDFRLLSGSPLIAAALSEASTFTTDIVGVSRGALWDIGPYQYAAGGPTPPTISAVANQSIVQDTSTGALAFTIGDAVDPSSSLTVGVTSSNHTLADDADCALGGSGANRTVNITPNAGQTGVTTIKLIVTNLSLLTATNTFTLTVTATVVPTTPSTQKIGHVNKKGKFSTR